MSGIWGLRERACAKTKARMEQDMGFGVMAWGVGACVCVCVGCVLSCIDCLWYLHGHPLPVVSPPMSYLPTTDDDVDGDNDDDDDDDG